MSNGPYFGPEFFSWKRMLGGKSFKTTWELSGRSLQRPPRGFDPEHPLIDDLKRKDFIVVRSYTEKQTCSPGFLNQFAKDCKAAGPFMKYLTRVLKLPY